MNVGANDTTDENSNHTDAPGGGKAETMIVVMDLDNYDLSYDGYAFFQPGTITTDSTTEINGPHKTYLESDQVQGSPPSLPYTAGGNFDSFNEFNRFICNPR